MNEYTVIVQADRDTYATLCVIEGRHIAYGPFRPIGRRFVANIEAGSVVEAAAAVRERPSLTIASPEVDHDGECFTVLSLVEPEEIRIVGAVAGTPNVHYRWSGMLSALSLDEVAASSAVEACSRAERDFYAALTDL